MADVYKVKVPGTSTAYDLRDSRADGLGTAAAKNVPSSGDASTTEVVMGDDTRLTDSRNAKDVYSWAKASTKPTYTASEVGAIATTAKGANNGVAELDSTGKVPSSQLPSFVDDVIEVDDYAHLPITGESGKIYVTKDTNKTYRWSGTAYVEISESLALGNTHSTAFYGDWGKTAYDHASETKLSTATASGLYKVAGTAQGHIASLTAVTKADITALGIPGSDTDRYVNSAAFADDTTSSANSPVKMTLTRAGSDTATVTGNIPKVSSSSAGVVPKGAAVSSQSQTTKFLREDGTWAAPSYSTIPTVNNATLTIQKNGTTVKTFTANASTDVTANITVPTKVSELTNDSGYTTNTGTVTSVATGVGLTGGTITGSGTVKAYMKSETKATYDSNTITNTQNKQYAVVPDKTGYLSVNVPWENTTYTAATAAPGNIATSGAVGTSTNYARQDHTHGISLATGDSFGQVKIAGTNVSIKGAGTPGYYGSNDADSNGWYKVCTKSLSGYSDDVITFLIMSGYNRQAAGVFHLHIRCDNGTALSIMSFVWLSHYGFTNEDLIVTTGDNTWSLYVNQTNTRYGRIQIRVLSNCGTAGAGGEVNLVSNTTKESTTPSGTYISDGAGYLPLSGGTMTGDIIFNKTGATDLTQVQMKCGANDYGRIAAGGTSNAGYLEIATADDGNEPIYARQYTGVYSSLQRTATLLDGSGNTSFPGKLTVSKAINELLTGTGTTAQDKGSGVSPRYFPAKWTMNVGIATPADGDTVTIKIPCAGHDFGVFLSLDNGTTYKPIGLKVQDNGRLTTHYGSGKIITLMYDSTAVVDQVFAAAGADSRSNITGAWKVITSYLDGNTYDRNVFGWTNIKAWGTALTAGNIIVGINGVFHHLKEGTAFDITYPILYLNAGVAANGTQSNVYDCLNFTITTTQSITLTQFLPVYIKGTLNGTTFTPVSTTPLTQTVPTSYDGYTYIELGIASSTTAVYMEHRHKMLMFLNGKFGEVVNAASNWATYAGASNYLTEHDYTSNTYTRNTDTYRFRANVTRKNKCGIDDSSTNGGILLAGNWTSSAYNAELFIGMGDNLNIFYRGVNNSSYTDWYPIPRFTQTAPTAGQIVITEGTGGIKASGYTIATSVPSGAVFTDTKVTQTPVNTNAAYEVLFSGTADNSVHTEGAGKYSNLLFNPSTSVLYGPNEMRARDLSVSASDGSSGGISLYANSSNMDSYGIYFRKITNKGAHGYVQGTWATYFTMSNDDGRGWIYKNKDNGNMASISNTGNAVFNGSVTIGGNAANTSGARMVYDSTSKAINFEFV